MLQVGDAEKFPHALIFKSLDLLFRVSKLGLHFTAVEGDVGLNRQLLTMIMQKTKEKLHAIINQNKQTSKNVAIHR